MIIDSGNSLLLKNRMIKSHKELMFGKYKKLGENFGKTNITSRCK